MPRDFIVCGNWKMNGSKSLVESLSDACNKVNSDIKIIIAPPYPYIQYARSLLKREICVAAQNMHYEKSGAYTGEISVHYLQSENLTTLRKSADTLLDIGTEWVIIGHSERRRLFGDTDEVEVSLNSGLNAIVCIGELFEDRESALHKEVIKVQLEAIYKVYNSNVVYKSKLVIAYEPVWAIGTGKIATPEQVEEMHSYIRKWISDNVCSKVADETPILYGGSVNASNYSSLKTLPNIDGFLVGGVSLKLDFVKICQ